MGLAAGANLNPERKFPSMFEPIHGSAPDIAGQGKANPFATVWSVSQMLEFFGYKEWAERLIDIIEEMLVEKKNLVGSFLLLHQGEMPDKFTFFFIPPPARPCTASYSRQRHTSR